MVIPSVGKRIKAIWYLWSARVHRHYGLAHADKEEFLSAVEDYRRAMECNPNLAPAYLERGILLWRELGRASHALRDLNTALTLKPNWGDALFTRGLAYQAAGDYHAAMNDLDAYVKQGDKKWRSDAASQLALIQSMYDRPSADGGLG